MSTQRQEGRWALPVLICAFGLACLLLRFLSICWSSCWGRKSKGDKAPNQRHQKGKRQQRGGRGGVFTKSKSKCAIQKPHAARACCFSFCSILNLLLAPRLGASKREAKCNAAAPFSLLFLFSYLISADSADSSPTSSLYPLLTNPPPSPNVTHKNVASPRRAQEEKPTPLLAASLLLCPMQRVFVPAGCCWLLPAAPARTAPTPTSRLPGNATAAACCQLHP